MEDTTPILSVVNFICSLLDLIPGAHSQLNWIKQHKGELSLFFYLHTVIFAIKSLVGLYAFKGNLWFLAVMGSIQPESEFIPSGRMVSARHLGCTNEFHFYDLETGKLNSTPFEKLCATLKVCTPLSLLWPPFHYYSQIG